MKRLGAVSYTHLDVYKRQMLGSKANVRVYSRGKSDSALPKE